MQPILAVPAAVIPAVIDTCCIDRCREHRGLWPGSRELILRTEQLFKLIEQGGLALEDLLAGLSEGQPGGSVHLGERAEPAAAGRVLHREGVAPGRLGVAVAFDGPGMDDLATGLSDGLKRSEIAANDKAGFLVELAPGGFERVLVSEFALGDGPCSLIPPGPERSALADLRVDRLEDTMLSTIFKGPSDSPRCER